MHVDTSCGILKKPRRGSPQPHGDTDVLTLQEAAKFYRVDPRTMIAMIETGKVKAKQVGTGKKRRDFRISKAHLVELLNGKP